ncbi:MAG: sigma-54-dependent Fis family transcriptional regulator [Acidobacteria bacterium]|nr:sigma-54-dependent Fis family transcriptional regulator [Acidobacteriota bacterium]
MKNARILLIDDDPGMVDLTSYQLEEQGYQVVSTGSGTEALKLVSEQSYDVALTDLHLPDVNGIELVRKLKEATPSTEIIMITGYSSVTRAIEAIKAGAFYFVEKPVEYEELLALVEKALERRRQAEEINQLRDKLKDRDSYYNIIGSSKAMQNLYEVIDRVAESDANIMIIGESGTGKELIANAIHYKSLRAKKPFVKINCSALPKELIESELFGHTKGAFTGASSEKNGLIGQATEGSLMLDEIGEMPIELQPKLLRVLQERVYYRLGSEKALEANFRLISATNREPRDAIREGHLREDLYYRINTIEIRVPPLRERAEDILHLAEHFLRVYAQKYERPVQMISQAAYEQMLSYSWPGNVRELQNVIERAVLLCKGNTIEAEAFPFSRAPVTTGSADPVAAPAAVALPVNGPAALTLNQEEPILQQLGRLIVSKVPEVRGDDKRFDVFDIVEGAVVSAALERTRGNKQAAANLLGVYRPRLYHMLRKHNMHQPQSEAEEDSVSHMAAESGH